MSIKVGINGFGRIGRLALRAAFDWNELEFVLVNDVAGDATTLAHLLEFDSVQGRWHHEVTSDGSNMLINGQAIATTNERDIDAVDWSGCDVVIEATGVHRKGSFLNKYLAQGVKRVVVSAPVKEEGIANIVVGVNDEIFDPVLHKIVTAASCTTNCIAPVVKVINEKLGIEQSSFTTIHDLTNTQTILDAPHKDLRRARACGMSLIPTTTGSAKAIVEIFPELKDKINGQAVRVPLANASLTDIIFDVKQDTTAEEVNALLEEASKNELKGILGFEARPLVSVDYRGDQRSTIVDGLSTMVVGSRMVKIYAWYDNEMGYATRTAELVRKVGLADVHPTWELEILEGKSALVLMPCPGTKGVELTSSLEQLKDQGVEAVVTALSVAEMEKAGVADLPKITQQLGMQWFNLPIEDDCAPDAPFVALWKTASPELHKIIQSGGKLAMHCMGGSGRTGILAAHLLLELDWDLDNIKSEVKALRPGAFTKQPQIDYINQVVAK